MASQIHLSESSHDALVTGHSPWGRTATPPRFKPLTESHSVDVAIIGGGITGALAAEHLSARGLSVVVLDQETPGLGSTAASTAMLQWEIDTQLGELELWYGFERAADIYRRSAVAVHGLGKLIRHHAIVCGFRPRSSLYLTNNPGGVRDLADEARLRRRAGLPSTFLEHPDLLAEFEIERDAALLSTGSAEADPLLLAWGLLDIAISRGAQLIKGTALTIDQEGRHVTIETDSPYVIEAKQVVLATGYAMPGLKMPKLHRTLSSWAMSTVPQDPSQLWHQRALLWEDSHPYLYARTTPDNRIVVGGEDEAIADPAIRDARLPQKIETIRRKLSLLWPQADTRPDHTWCGTFGETIDGLPLIGPVPGMPRVFASFGYGGNGITFSYLAAQIAGATFAGIHRTWFDDFALDRDAPAKKHFATQQDNAGAAFH